MRALVLALALAVGVAALGVPRKYEIQDADFMGNRVHATQFQQDGPTEPQILKPWEIDVKMAQKNDIWPTALSNTEDRIGTKLTPRPFFQTATLGVPTDGTITLTAQCDKSRMDRIGQMAEMWNGPISLAVLVQSSEVSEVHERIFNMDDHIKNTVSFHVMEADKKWKFYPINAMRNLALENAKTEFVLVIDIDENIMPMKQHLQYMKKIDAKSDPKAAFALRSFEWAGHRDPEAAVPKSWDTLANYFWNKKVNTKHPYYTRAYAYPTFTFIEWENMKRPERLPLKDAWEPYFIAHKDSMGKFNTNFVGYRGNKVSMVTKMQMDGWQFYLLPKVFTFTDEDETTREVNKWRTEADGQVQDMDLYPNTLKDLAASHPGCNKDQCIIENCLATCEHLKDFVIKDPNDGAYDDLADRDKSLMQEPILH